MLLLLRVLDVRVDQQAVHLCARTAPPPPHALPISPAPPGDMCIRIGWIDAADAELGWPISSHRPYRQRAQTLPVAPASDPTDIRRCREHDSEGTGHVRRGRVPRWLTSRGVRPWATSPARLNGAFRTLARTVRVDRPTGLTGSRAGPRRVRGAPDCKGGCDTPAPTSGGAARFKTLTSWISAPG
jgi:hypothetical protein